MSSYYCALWAAILFAPQSGLNLEAVKIAAFDVGSNAIRLAQAVVGDNGQIQIRKRTRFPLRLGTEAFADGRFSPATIQRVADLFYEQRQLLDRQKVDLANIRAVATSAYRSADNAQELGLRVKRASGITIEAISGTEEAQLIRRAVQTAMPLERGDFLLFDIGGGSVELSLLSEGRPVLAQSFPLGTIRLLELAHARGEDFKTGLIQECVALRTFFSGHSSGQLEVVGTGGNFKRLLKIRNTLRGERAEFLLPREIDELIHELQGLSPAQITRRFDLEVGQADLVVPALHLIAVILEMVSVSKVHAPPVGLVHGVLAEMVENGPF